jgi:muramoyltetrapeptide carboxypeptidase
MKNDITCPAFLKSGDSIGLCATARKVSAEEMEDAIKTLESWGLYVVLGKNLYGEENQFSGTEEQRVEDLQQFFNDPNIKAVISGRGGYGTLRIIDKIDFSEFNKNPKWVIGYSDITVLHSHIHTNCHVNTLHATMPINFGKDEYSTETLRKSLFGESLSYRSENFSFVKNREGIAEGQIVGGNLSLLYSMQGSVSDLDTNGKILFLEDLDEYLYHIDRMILSLKRAGKFSGIKGLIIGGMDDMKDNTTPFGKNAEEIIAEHVAEYNFPVCYRFPAGHDTKNYALQLGRNVKLDVGEKETELFFL